MLWINPIDLAGWPSSVVTALTPGTINIYDGPVPADGLAPLTSQNALIGAVFLLNNLSVSGNYLRVSGLPFGYGTLLAYNGMPTTFFRAVDSAGTVHLQGTCGFGAGASWQPSALVKTGAFVEALGQIWECATDGTTGSKFPTWTMPALPAPYVQYGALVGTLPIGFPNVVGTWQQPTWLLADGGAVWLWLNELPDLMLNRNNLQQNSTIVVLNQLLPTGGNFSDLTFVLDSAENGILDYNVLG